MTARASLPSIIIIGGGASGILMAAHLLRGNDADIRVTIVEKGPAFGKGIAYSTTLPDHVLNVSALGMSAYADDPEHFFRWLVETGQATPENPAVYVPRRIYGEYLASVLAKLRGQEATTGRLRTIAEECLSVQPTASGVEVRLANGTSIVGHAAILAVGHEEQPSPDHAFAIRPGPESDTPLEADAPVLILGTGLSMVDMWLSLESRGHRGPVVAVSRRGLLPSVHRKGNPIRLDRADIPLGTELSYFVRWFRDLVRATENAGGNWRDVVDGLRPFNQLIWQNWPVSAKRRFIEHTKAWWDIHRHRMPPPIHERVSEAVSDGRIRLVAAKVINVDQTQDGYAATLQPRHTTQTEILRATRIYDCTGIVSDLSTGSNPVVRSLIDRGLARPDPLRIGLDVGQDCAVLNGDGIPSKRLYAIGPLTRGAFLEIDAIPDIRIQCAGVARHLVG
ncbi:FAD/NAD(P)-binding protein [Mesorhizobium sp. 1B3]|uniref:FAD/NAD(P)-binding protein n=1 Tax=Mesorhizobium sp. 1B3 TaxID=3243599 RepID=UPI003D96634B